MSSGALILRGLRHYWRTNLAVIAGVAIAVSVLAGALLVGESVRASLRGLVDERLGRTAVVVTGQGFFRHALADEIKKAEGFRAQFADAASLIAIEASITHEQSGREASRIQVYGVDESLLPASRRDWRRGAHRPSGAAQSWHLPPSSARPQTMVCLLRVQKPSAIPADSLAWTPQRHVARRPPYRPARRWRPSEWASSRCGRSRRPCAPSSCPSRDCSVTSTWRGARTCCCWLLRSDQAPDAAAAEHLLNAHSHARRPRTPAGARRGPARVGDRERDRSSWRPRSSRRLARWRSVWPSIRRVLTYLANTIRIGGRAVPYSVVTGVDPGGTTCGPVPVPPLGSSDRTAAAAGNPRTTHPPIWLNQWAATDLGAKPGDEVDARVLPLVRRERA